jgi:thiol-disulfide isomerase/thioredoxin
MKILKFYTPTCVPCRALGKILEKVDAEVEEINALEDIEKVDWYNVCTTPTLIFLNEKDEEVARTVGMKTQSQIEEIIKNNT